MGIIMFNILIYIVYMLYTREVFYMGLANIGLYIHTGVINRH